MNPKYLAIVVVFVALIGVFIYKSPRVVEEVVPIPAENVPVIPASPVVPAPIIVPENPEGEAEPSVMKLDMKTWQWIQVSYNDGRKITPKKSERFNLTFRNDGTFSATTDCNGVGGNYTVGADRRITFSNMMSTLMFCEGSQEGEFRNVLEDANVYSFTSRGELLIDLKFDSGTATFK